MLLHTTVPSNHIILTTGFFAAKPSDNPALIKDNTYASAVSTPIIKMGLQSGTFAQSPSEQEPCSFTA
jgi:hypothetical protein